LDTVILAIFTIEVVLKLISFKFKWWRYFHSGWNNFDFIIVVGSYIPGAGSMLVVLRLLRLLRVLKLVRSLPALQVIVIALMQATKSIVWIGLIMFITFYVFAIGGMIFFRDNDPWHFGSLHIAMLSLFRAATFEDWTDIMYINMYGCDKYASNGMNDEEMYKCTNPQAFGFLALMYFWMFELIGALVLLTLFVGVVTTAMDEATEEQKERKEELIRVSEEVNSAGLSTDTIDLFRAIFHRLDLDGDGTIDNQEMSMGLNKVNQRSSLDSGNGTSGELTQEHIAAMIAQVDTDGDGSINFTEFMIFMANLELARKEKSEADPTESSFSPSPFSSVRSIARKDSSQEKPAHATEAQDSGGIKMTSEIQISTQHIDITDVTPDGDKASGSQQTVVAEYES